MLPAYTLGVNSVSELVTFAHTEMYPVPDLGMLSSFPNHARAHDFKDAWYTTLRGTDAYFAR